MQRAETTSLPSLSHGAHKIHVDFYRDLCGIEATQFAASSTVPKGLYGYGCRSQRIKDRAGNAADRGGAKTHPLEDQCRTSILRLPLPA